MLAKMARWLMIELMFNSTILTSIVIIPTIELNIGDFLANLRKSGFEMAEEVICWDDGGDGLLLRMVSVNGTNGRMKAGLLMVLWVGLGREGGVSF